MIVSRPFWVSETLSLSRTSQPASLLLYPPKVFKALRVCFAVEFLLFSCRHDVMTPPVKTGRRFGWSHTTIDEVFSFSWLNRRFGRFGRFGRSFSP